MAKPHIRLILDLTTITIANNVKTWLDSKLNSLGLNKNLIWKGDGEVFSLIPDSMNELEYPRIVFFANLNHTDKQTEFLNLLKNKIKTSALNGKIKYVKVEKWICNHDEDKPTPCVPNIIHEEVF